MTPEGHRALAAPSALEKTGPVGEAARDGTAPAQSEEAPQSAAFAFAVGAGGGALTVSQPGDDVERDAERRADTVAPRPAGARGQRGSSAVDASVVRDAVDSPSRPLEGHERSAVAGADPAAVRVHTGGRASASARALGAAAYTVGDDVVLGDGYDAHSVAGRRLLAHELAHVAQQRTDPGPPLVRRDLAIEPLHPEAAPVLSDAAAADAIAFNARTITDPAEIELLRDIVGVEPTPAVIDADFVRAVATYQGGLGLPADGKIGSLTRRRLSFEILAEAATLPAGGLGDLATALQLRTDLTTLIGAGNTNYADYRTRIRAATILQRDICLADTAFLTQLRVRLAWNDFARCVELFGRRAPTFAELVGNPTVAAALAAAWGASSVGVNPPVGAQHEEGGWVYLNLITNALSVTRQAAGAGAAINLAAPPVQADSVVVAKFHTHPNLGPGWLAAPSPADTAVDAVHGVPDIVVGTPGVNPAVFQTFASGPAQRLHLAGNQGLPGAAGGLAPQARIGIDESHDEQ